MLEDSALDAELIAAHLSRAGLTADLHRVWSQDDFVAALEQHAWDVILADHVLPGFDGDTALMLACRIAPDIPFIFVSGTLTEDLAVNALTRGARDYVVKQRLQRLPDAIRRAITERDERRLRLGAEGELQKSRDRLQLITDALPALIAHLGPDHRYRFANKAYNAWHGLAPEQLEGTHAREVMGEDAFSAMAPWLDRVLAGERVSFELQLPTAADAVRYVQVDGVPDIADGEVIGYYTLARDISDLKRAELSLRGINDSLERQIQQRTAELRRSEDRLQAIFQSSFQHQVLLDTEGTVLDANRASLAAILASRHDVTDRPFADADWFAATPGAGDTVRAAVRDAAAGIESRHELDLELPTGRRSFEFSFRALRDPDDTITAVVSEAVETTARRQAEEALRQTQKIEAIGQLTGGIAHDFNNILTVIAGNVEHAMLLSERRAGGDAVIARALDNALKGVTRAAGLTQRLLAFARRQPLRNEVVDLNAHVRGMQDMLQRALGELVQLEIRTLPDIWPIEADPGQLEASVLNLAVNARDAMPEGGRLWIEVDNTHLDEDHAAQHPELEPGQYVILRVRDSGHGMSAETMARVFEPFFTTKDVGRGTGLGLSMVYGFVRQSGGHVLMDSRPGAGTTVTMLFPRSVQPLSSAGHVRGRDEDAQAAREETILVAEDNDDVRAHTVEVLRQLGYRVLEAHDGPTALRLLDRPDVHVDLLFSDVVMPGMSGWELARQVQHRKPGLGVLFTSGYPRDIGAQGNPGTAIALLPKPFTRSDLADAIRGALERAA